MPSDVATSCKIPFLGLGNSALAEQLRAWGWPPFRATQLYDWVYHKMVSDPQLMTNFTKVDRAMLAERFDFATGTITRQQNSTDQRCPAPTRSVQGLAAGTRDAEKQLASARPARWTPRGSPAQTWVMTSPRFAADLVEIARDRPPPRCC